MTENRKWKVVLTTLLLICLSVVCLFAAEAETDEVKKQEEWTKMDTGLTYKIVTNGDGQVATKGQRVSVHYTGTFTDGTKFDSSVDRGVPFEFVLGAGNVIRGWDIGVEGMKIGEKRILQIPSDLAYGKRGAGGVIPPDTDLVFEVELLGIGQ